MICRRMWISRAARGASRSSLISCRSDGRQSVDRSQPGTSEPGRSSTCGQALPAWTWLADGRVTNVQRAQDRRNVLRTPRSSDQPRRGVLHWLELLKLVVRNDVQRGIAVVEANMNKCLGGLGCQRVHNTAELTQLIIARPVDGSDLLSHWKSIVKNDTKVANASML